jgi:Asp/Glu/hydantoin racemase
MRENSAVRIWWQSFVDPEQNAPYLERLASYLAEIAAPNTVVDVHGISPPDRGFGRLTELRCAVLAVDNALEAEAAGYDGFAMGHFQDPGLYEARSAVEIPVVGLGESSMHWAAQLGRNIALVSIDPVFTNWHHEQADRYGLRGRVTHVTGLGALVETFAPAFAGDEDAYRALLEQFRRAARRGRSRRRDPGRRAPCTLARTRACPDRRQRPGGQLRRSRSQVHGGRGRAPSSDRSRAEPRTELCPRSTRCDRGLSELFIARAAA